MKGNKKILNRNSRNRIPGGYIVNFAPGVDEKTKEAIVNQFGGRVKKRFRSKEMERFAVVEIPDSKVDDLLAHDLVEEIEQDIVAEPPSTTELENWGMYTAMVRNFWEAGYTGTGVRVAIIDTGVNPHVDLPNMMGHWDVVTNSARAGEVPDSPKEHGHGTLSAGIIGARNNTLGIRGVAYDCDMFSVCCYYYDPTYDDGKGSNVTHTSLAVEALEYVYERMNPRPDVVLCNVQLLTGSPALQTACNQLVNAGIPILAAAGNYASDDVTEDTVRYPGAYSNVVAVGAAILDMSSGQIIRAGYSGTGPKLDIASFTNQYSTSANGTGYKTYSGTSCATPFATGVMALLKQAYPNYSATQLYNKLYESVTPYGTQNEFGRGLIGLPINALPVPPTYPLLTSPVTEEFEDSSFNFNMSGEWVVSRDGTRTVLKTPALGDLKSAYQTIKFRLPLNVTNAVLNVVHRVHSHTSDRFAIFVNGIPAAVKSGLKTSYETTTIPLEPGKAYRIDFLYFKNMFLSSGDDAVYIDSVQVNYDTTTMITETFESNTLTIPFRGDWERVTTSPYAGSYCYRNKLIGHSQTSQTSFRVNAPSGGMLEFYYRTDCEERYDKLFVTAGSTTILDGVSGEGGAWTRVTYTLPAGTTEITFKYTKDVSVSRGTDSVYIDQVTVSGQGVTVSPGSGSGTAPGTPSLTVGSPTTSSLTLNYSASGATSYDIYRNGTRIVTGRTTTSYTDSGLSSGTRYNYYVVARNAYGTSTSSTVSGTTQSGGSAPGTPSLTVGSATTSSLTLNYTASGATSYDIYRNGTRIVTGRTTTSYTDSGLSSGTRYNYYVVARNAYGTSTSSTVSGTTQSGGSAPGTPSLTVGSATTSSLTLTYNATGATSYDIYRNGTLIVSGRTSTSYTNTGLSPNTTYTYHVVARNSYGTSTSTTRSGTTLPVPRSTVEARDFTHIYDEGASELSATVITSSPITGGTFDVYVGGDVATSTTAPMVAIGLTPSTLVNMGRYQGSIASGTALMKVATGVSIPPEIIGATRFTVRSTRNSRSSTYYDVAPGEASAYVSTTKTATTRMVVVFNLET